MCISKTSLNIAVRMNLVRVLHLKHSEEGIANPKLNF